VRAVARAVFVFASTLLLGSLTSSAWAAHPPRPTARDQALSDGCQRSDLGIGFDTSPEWVYVYRSPTIRMARGVVRVPHSALGDSILTHRGIDFTANLVPEPQFGYLIAGSRAAGTNNFGPTEGESYGRLHFERDGAALPTFVWPADGDGATIWGSWIWDCGHWTTSSINVGGTVTGEHTELHPIGAIVVNRRTPFLSSSGESQTDVFISNDGTPAHAVEQCALSHHPTTGTSFPQYDSGDYPCASSTANQIQPLERSYTFFVPAPPKPAAGAALRYRVVTRVPSSGVERIRPNSDGIQVTVRLRNANHFVHYGKSFLVSWTAPPRRPVVALKVTLKSILIKQADPNPAVADPSGANWNLYLDINGYWQLLNKWAPALTTHVVDGERISINRTFKVNVPRGARVSFMVQGRECDEPAGKFETVFGITRYANLLYPCPRNLDEQNQNPLLWFANDDPGTILNIYRSAGAAIGKHVVTARATVKFPGTGKITFGDGVQGQGGYELTYTIRRG
jgi:hypothetical protein